MVQRYGYTANEEIADRVEEVIHAYTHKWGREPAVLLLGYGTYISFCMFISRHRYSQWSSWQGQIDWLDEWMNSKIVVDPGYEYRCEAIDGNPKETAIIAVMANRKPESDA